MMQHQQQWCSISCAMMQHQLQWCSISCNDVASAKRIQHQLQKWNTDYRDAALTTEIQHWHQSQLRQWLHMLHYWGPHRIRGRLLTTFDDLWRPPTTIWRPLTTFDDQLTTFDDLWRPLTTCDDLWRPPERVVSNSQRSSPCSICRFGKCHMTFLSNLHIRVALYYIDILPMLIQGSIF